MADKEPPVAIHANKAKPRTRASNYPEPFASRMAGRERRPLGAVFGLANFGVNHTRLAPGSVSVLRHPIPGRMSSSTSWRAGLRW